MKKFKQKLKERANTRKQSILKALADGFIVAMNDPRWGSDSFMYLAHERHSEGLVFTSEPVEAQPFPNIKDALEFILHAYLDGTDNLSVRKFVDESSTTKADVPENLKRTFERVKKKLTQEREECEHDNVAFTQCLSCGADVSDEYEDGDIPGFR